MGRAAGSRVLPFRMVRNVGIIENGKDCRLRGVTIQNGKECRLRGVNI
jgi:hypothetical protein